MIELPEDFRDLYKRASGREQDLADVKVLERISGSERSLPG
jgi:hypothetical protein